ncbi:MAG: DUF692 domain-containing protein [Gemmataceae bacterium]|nr:DUF692 domain-containing protein [Gemmataceae bacterium]
MLPATGYAMRDANRPYADERAWNGVEIDFQMASDPLRIEPYLTGLSFDYVSLHTLDLSIASPHAPARSYLDALVMVAEENGAVAISDHLGFTHGTPGGANVGHVMAPPCTEAALDATCRNIEIIQRHFGDRKFYVENLAHFFLMHGTMAEATFIRRMLERTGCGLLLDVTNAYANERNFGHNAEAFIREVVPAADRLQMHLAGGFLDARTAWYVDSHSEPVPAEVWRLYRLALELGRGKVDAAFIERDWNAPTEGGWRAEVRQVRRIARETERMELVEVAS